MIKVCFVCTGNTCRSVMAERLMKASLKSRKIENISVSSRGLNVESGSVITDNAKKTLKKLKASAANRKAVQLKKIDKSTLYVTMTTAQKAYVKSARVITFADLIGCDILDPYGQDEQVYFLTAQQIRQGVETLINKLLSWREL